MFKIAVCENDEQDLNLLLKRIEVWQENNPSFRLQVESFQNPKALLKVTANTFFDLYILDIIMPEMSGIEVGREIRLRQSNVAIIYTTASKEFALDAYDLHAERYILKPVTQDALNESFDFIVPNSHRKETPYIITNGSLVVTLIIEDIMYIENVGHSVTFTLRDGRKQVQNRRSGKFEEAIAQVTENKQFIQTHKSYFVNMNYIRSMSSSQIEMDDGHTVPVNRRRSETVQNAYLNFIQGMDQAHGI